MNTYVKPEFGFQELKLYERVADTCWGTAQIWLDTNGDGGITGADINLATGGGCKGNDSAGAINNAIAEFNTMANAYNETHDINVVKAYNSVLADWVLAKMAEDHVESVDLTGITATATSNWANTQQTSVPGIIIIKSV